MAHAGSFRINISIASMHRLTDSILDVSNIFQHINIPVNEIICVSPQAYYLGWSERYYPNVPLNIYYGPLCLQFMNLIQGRKPVERQWNILLGAVVTILKNKKLQLITIYTSNSYLMEQCPILQYLWIILSTPLIMRQSLLN